MIQTPQERGNGDVNHGKIIAHDVFVFGKCGCQHGQALGNGFACFGLFFGCRFRCFQNLYMAEQFAFQTVEYQTAAATLNGVSRHQLGMREAFVYVFVDDVGFVQYQIALYQNRYLVIRIHDGQIFRFVENIHVFNFKIHPFFI